MADPILSVFVPAWQHHGMPVTVIVKRDRDGDVVIETHVNATRSDTYLTVEAAERLAKALQYITAGTLGRLALSIPKGVFDVSTTPTDEP